MDEHPLNRTDFDLGSTTPAVVGDRHVFQVGKSGIGYLLNQDHLRGEGGELFAASLNGCYAIGGDAFKDTGATVAEARIGVAEHFVSLAAGGGRLFAPVHDRLLTYTTQ